jgi:hypothetical protein
MARTRRPPGLVKVTLKSIQRVENDGHGWRVHVSRSGTTFVRHFPDADDGPFNSLRAAIAARDAAWRRIGPSVQVRAASRRSRGPVVGVNRLTRSGARGELEYWIATWIDHSGTQTTKCFSISKYGDGHAYRLAVQTRTEGVASTRRQQERRLLDRLHQHTRAGVGDTTRTSSSTARPVRVTLKNIHRLEKEGHGWRVHVTRGYRAWAKYFPDGADGPFGSLRSAVVWRDGLWRRVGPPTHTHAVAKQSPGPIGVNRETKHWPSGRAYDYWVATWIGPDGRQHDRTFSVNKFGEQDARRLAVEARRAGVAATAKLRERRLLDVLHAHQRAVCAVGAEVEREPDGSQPP